MAYNNKGYNFKIVGTILEKLGRGMDALELYDMAISLNKTNANAYNNKGFN